MNDDLMLLLYEEGGYSTMMRTLDLTLKHGRRYLRTVIETYVENALGTIAEMELELVDHPEMLELGKLMSRDWYVKWRFVTLEKAG